MPTSASWTPDPGNAGVQAQVPPQQNEPPPSPPSSPVLWFLGLLPLITTGGLLYKGAIFSPLFFLLLYSDVRTTGSPLHSPQNAQEEARGWVVFPLL